MAKIKTNIRSTSFSIWFVGTVRKLDYFLRDMYNEMLYSNEEIN